MEARWERSPRNRKKFILGEAGCCRPDMGDWDLPRGTLGLDVWSDGQASDGFQRQD